jgi:pyridoxamine 5'-phosphate oxidase
MRDGTADTRRRSAGLWKAPLGTRHTKLNQRNLALSQLTSGDFTENDDPFALFADWQAAAETTELNDPTAMALATVDPDGLPNVRMVLLKAWDARGFVFYTNFESAKGRELLASGKAAALFHWKSQRKQIRIRGPIETVSTAEADAYFAERPRGSQTGAWASQQSRPLASRAVLVEAVAEVEAAHPGAVPRPPHWSGFRILPVEIEFWSDGAYRLHDRIVFRRQDQTAPWTKTRLFP